jgi:peptidoglycan LD-endopeptidase LytH
MRHVQPLPGRWVQLRHSGALFAFAGAVTVAGCGQGGLPDPASFDEPGREASGPSGGTLVPPISAASLPPPPELGAAPDGAPATALTRASEATALEVLSAGLGVPVSGVARSQLRDTYDEQRGDGSHEAMDIAAARGTPVLSASDGRLLKLFDSVAGGLMVYAADPSGRFILLYGHLDRYADGLVEGMLLTRGQLIGYVGTTGNAPAGTPHLHFGVLRGDAAVAWWKGGPVNPFPLLVH